jgi:hypothetical protein
MSLGEFNFPAQPTHYFSFTKKSQQALGSKHLFNWLFAVVSI